jgi:hypothetical protein
MGYPTVEELKSRLKITDGTADSDLTIVLAGATAWVQEYVGRNLSGTNIAVADEKYDLDGITQTKDNFIIMLRNMDITAITDVKLGDQSIDAEEYQWNAEGRLVIFGKLFDVNSMAFNDYAYVQVTYTYNKATPADVFNAILSLAVLEWNALLASRQGTASSGVGSASQPSGGVATKEKIGEYSVTYADSNDSQKTTGALSGASSSGSLHGAGMNSILRMLSHYRKRRV